VLAILGIGVAGTLKTFAIFDSDDPNELSFSPWGISAVVASAFLVLGAFFLAYVHSVNRRTALIIANAAHANAIVTNMFPGDFRDQMIEDREKGELRQGGIEANTIYGGVEKVGSSSKPIANRHLDTTVSSFVE